MPVLVYNRFAHGISHIFAVSHAAGYYSFDVGGSRPAVHNVAPFRGGNPPPAALLRQRGIDTGTGR